MTTRGSAAIRCPLSTVNYPLNAVNEAETRAEHIDPALAAAGWGVVDGSRIRREYPIALGRIEGHGRRGKALKADYVLEYRNTKLATVEAKAWDEALTEGVGQAKDYATKLAIRYTYATNGQGIYAIDMKTGHEAEVPQYPAPDELWGMIATFWPIRRSTPSPHSPKMPWCGSSRMRSARRARCRKKRQPVLHDLPDVHVWSAKGRRSIAMVRRLSTGLL